LTDLCSPGQAGTLTRPADYSGDFERLIGRKPTGFREFLGANYPTVIPELEALAWVMESTRLVGTTV